MNDNTVLRIKVPAHLYESVKEQLTLTEAAKAKKQFGAEFSVIKEKKMKAPKDGMHKVEEKKEEVHTEMEKKHRSLDELKAAKDKLEKKIAEMEGHSKDKEVVKEEESLEEVTGAQMSAEKIGDLLNIDPALAGAAIVGGIALGVIKGPEIANVVKTSLQMAADKGKDVYAKLKSIFDKKGITKGEETPAAEPMEENEQAKGELGSESKELIKKGKATEITLDTKINRGDVMIQKYTDLYCTVKGVSSDGNKIRFIDNVWGDPAVNTKTSVARKFLLLKK